MNVFVLHSLHWISHIRVLSDRLGMTFSFVSVSFASVRGDSVGVCRRWSHVMTSPVGLRRWEGNGKMEVVEGERMKKRKKKKKKKKKSHQDEIQVGFHRLRVRSFGSASFGVASLGTVKI